MFEIYNIKEGENIKSIADTYNIDINYLYKINGFDCDRNINTGDNIIVPKLYNNYIDYYTIKEGISLDDFAKNNKINKILLSNLNGLNIYDYLYPNQVIVIPKENVNFYITNNDTLDNVCKIMKVKIEELIKENNKIYLKDGQLIVYKEK